MNGLQETYTCSLNIQSRTNNEGNIIGEGSDLPNKASASSRKILALYAFAKVIDDVEEGDERDTETCADDSPDVGQEICKGHLLHFVEMRHL